MQSGDGPLVDRRNVTLSLPERIVRQARHLAVEQGVSLSKYLSQVLENEVLADAEYRRARERWRRRIEAALDRGTGGQAAWSRQDVHER